MASLLSGHPTLLSVMLGKMAIPKTWFFPCFLWKSHSICFSTGCHSFVVTGQWHCGAVGKVLANLETSGPFWTITT